MAEAKDLIKDITPETAIETLNSLLDELVEIDTSNPAKTLAGELVRAVSFIGNAYYESGDYFFSSSCDDNARLAATYLSKASPKIKEALDKCLSDVDPLLATDENKAKSTFEDDFKNLCVVVLTYLKDNDDLFTRESSQDCLNVDEIVYNETPNQSIEIKSGKVDEGATNDDIEEFINLTYIDPLFEDDDNYPDINITISDDGVKIENITVSQVKLLNDSDIENTLWDRFNKHFELLNAYGEVEDFGGVASPIEDEGE